MPTAYRPAIKRPKPVLPPVESVGSDTGTDEFSEWFGKRVASAGMVKRGGNAKKGWEMTSGPYKGRTYNEAAAEGRIGFDIEAGRTPTASPQEMDAHFRRNRPGIDAIKSGAVFSRLNEMKRTGFGAKPTLLPVNAAAEFKASLPMRQQEAASNAQMAAYFGKNPTAFGQSGSMSIGSPPRPKPALPMMGNKMAMPKSASPPAMATPVMQGPPKPALPPLAAAPPTSPALPTPTPLSPVGSQVAMPAARTRPQLPPTPSLTPDNPFAGPARGLRRGVEIGAGTAQEMGGNVVRGAMLPGAMTKQASEAVGRKMAKPVLTGMKAGLKASANVAAGVRSVDDWRKRMQRNLGAAGRYVVTGQ